MTATDTYAHHDALQTVCKRCRSHTRIHYVFEEDGKLFADIVSELEDPRDLNKRFEKIGYDVIQITHMGGDYFQFMMTIQAVKA